MTAKVYVDNTNKQWAVSEWNEKTDVKIYKYVNLLDFELIEDEESVIKGAAGRALVGGALSGTTGAIIGSAGSKKIKQNCNLLEVRIRTDDFENPQYVIPYIKGFAVAKTSSMYKNSVESAQELISVLNYITSNGEKTASVSEVPETKSGVGERLRELNDLKNEGILTAEEFETEKKKILNGNG